ncbi:guanylin family protein [Astyanax mexicanus]|uniref:Guanylate cyclase activator 2B n=2 Tax=Astyanax mexicanus TaxID=7994 RepID=A0A8B9KLU9_ASTMX|nr:guanylin family protein [Astyanax mexicanus]KAG9260158.1 guanylin-like [Astyanax mexicanus]
MKTIASIALLFSTLCLFSEAIQVQDGEYFFSAESVKVLQKLSESGSSAQQQNPRLATTSYSAVCANPTLPQEFVPLCNQSGSSMVFSRLAAVPMDVCEICAFAACTGC